MGDKPEATICSATGAPLNTVCRSTGLWVRNGEPSLTSARLLLPPPAIATTLVNPAGMFVCPKLLSPQAMIVPSLFNTKLW